MLDNKIFCFNYFFYLFINYNTITNNILIIYELSNFDHVLGVVLQGREPDNRTHDPRVNSPAHYNLDYQGTLITQPCMGFANKMTSGVSKVLIQNGGQVNLINFYKPRSPY